MLHIRLLLAMLSSGIALQLKDRYGLVMPVHKPQDAANAQPVFYTIVMGDLAHRHQVTLWLTSLRKIGGFRGDVVIVTDRPRCVEKTLENAGLLGEEKSRSDDVDIFYPKDGRRDIEEDGPDTDASPEGCLHILKRPSTDGNIMKMKLEKARAWVNVHNAGIPYPISSIIYTDQDFIFGKDLNGFVGKIHHMEKAKQYLLALFKEDLRDHEVHHTGMIVMFAGQRAEKCLSDWAQWFIASPNQSSNTSVLVDQAEDSETLGTREIEVMKPESRALMETPACKANAGGILQLQRSYLWLPTNSGMRETKSAEFIHFSNIDRWPGETDLIKHSKGGEEQSASWRARRHETRQYLRQLGIPGEVEPFAITDSPYCPIRKDTSRNTDANYEIPRASALPAKSATKKTLEKKSNLKQAPKPPASSIPLPTLNSKTLPEINI